jgi:hypothetical protein
MKKCDLCDAEATVHITEAEVRGDETRTITRHLCEECAQRVCKEYPSESGSVAPTEDESPEEIVAKAKQFAELMRNRNNRELASQLYDNLLRLRDCHFPSFDIQSPLYKRLRELHVPFGSTQQFPESREEWIDFHVQRMNQFWDRYVAFVEKHKRWPTDEEMNGLYGE